MMPQTVIAATCRAAASGNADQAATIARLQGAVDDLQAALGMKDAAHYPRRLSPTQRAMLGMLVRRASVTRGQFMLALYAGRAAADLPTDADTVLKVQLNYLRRRLKPDGIEIETINGRAALNAEAHYRLPAEAKRKIAAIMTGDAS